MLQNEEDRHDLTMKEVVGRIIALKLITCREEILCESIEENQMINNKRYPIDIEEAIINKKAVAAVDVSIDKRYIAICWIVTTLNNKSWYQDNIIST